jgi:cupin fold WbuC family metalloprotein
MPELIYSKAKPEVLLLAINRSEGISSERTDICPDSEYLQICVRDMEKGTFFKPHKHNNISRSTDITQEAWIILQGSIEASFWDIDDKKIYETILKSGDCAVVFRAGHSFTVLEENTTFYEIKTGPYYGVDKDKTFIEDKS